MVENQKAKSAGGCGCSSKAAAKPEAPATKSGCCGGSGVDHDPPATKSGCCTGHSHDHHPHHAAAGADVVDPVCGMTVDPETSMNRMDYRGETYHFCSAGCRTKFEAAPQQYLGKSNETQHADVPAGTIYTCPMHPQIRQVGPGSCPICGMALEPELVALDDRPNPDWWT